MDRPRFPTCHRVANRHGIPTPWEHEPLRLIVAGSLTKPAWLSDDPRARRRRTIRREQLDLGLSGEADLVYGYSFILTDLVGEAGAVVHHHRDRAQI